jgi:hypothetical protein
MVAQHAAHRATQQRGEMAGHRRDDQHRWLVRLEILPEMQQIAKRRLVHDLFGDIHFTCPHLDVLDAEIGALMGETGARKNLAGGSDPGHQDFADFSRPGTHENVARDSGGGSYRIHQVCIPLVGLIDHGGCYLFLVGRFWDSGKPSAIRAP